jgi:hypothetical protein
MWRIRAFVGRTAILSVALASVGTIGILGFTAAPALASYRGSVQGRTPQIVGNAASDKLALRLAPGSPNILQVDVGDDGTADFSLDRSTFDAIVVNAGAGNDEVRVDDSFGSFADDALTLDGGAGNDVLGMAMATTR